MPRCSMRLMRASSDSFFLEPVPTAASPTGPTGVYTATLSSPTGPVDAYERSAGPGVSMDAGVEVGVDWNGSALATVVSRDPTVRSAAGEGENAGETTEGWDGGSGTDSGGLEA